MNRATKANATAVGVVFGIGGIAHGLGEALQGNTPTDGLVVNAIAAGSSWTRWSEGGEPAFTLVPNFLVTGILATLVGLAVIVWSAGFLHRRRGALVYLLLFILLFLVGGGIGQVLFFVPAWAVATRIHKPLTWWRRTLPGGVRRGLARLWPPLPVAASLSALTALAIVVFGYLPGVADPERIFATGIALISAAWVIYLAAYVAGFAYDVERAEG